MAEQHDILGEALFALASLAVGRLGRELSLTAASTLATLERTGPRRLTDLAVSEGVTQPSMTALVSQLAERGLAERRPDPADRRVVLVAISGDGEQYLSAMRRAGASVYTALIDKLDDHEVAALDAVIPVLRHLLELVAQSQDGDAGPSKGMATARSRTGSAPQTSRDRSIR